MPFVSTKTPPTAVTKHFYLKLWSTALETHPDRYSPAAEWVRTAPALEHTTRRQCLREEVFELTLKGFRGKHLAPLVKSHAWTLWQRRLTARFVECPWCGAKQNNVSSEEKFMHEAWGCPIFRTHWNNLRPATRVPHISSIAEIALGVDPRRPNKPLKSEHRLRALILHTAMWYHRPKLIEQQGRLLDYSQTLVSFYYMWKRANKSHERPIHHKKKL